MGEKHHCRLCGLIFCNKDCDITCELPAITLPGRCCIDCYSLIDPLSPTNLYRQQQVLLPSSSFLLLPLLPLPFYYFYINIYHVHIIHPSLLLVIFINFIIILSTLIIYNYFYLNFIILNSYL